jgi:hypothetical protein
MEAWLAAHALKPAPRVVWPTEPSVKEKEPGVAQEVAARRTRTADAQRKKLHELIETLSARDIDKVAAFAEFVKARRAARGFVPRHEGESAAGVESDPTASPAPLAGPADAGEHRESQETAITPPSAPTADDEVTPSSRKRPAAR